MRWLALLLLILLPSYLLAGEIRQSRDESTGWTVYELSQEGTTIKVVPAAGANVQQER